MIPTTEQINADTSFSLGSYAVFDEDFPVGEYTTNKTNYEKLESWYNGAALNKTENQQGKQVDIYPVKINPFKNIVSKHVSALFGETNDDERPLVVIRGASANEDKKVGKKEAQFVENILNTIWYENNGRSLQLEQGFVSQVYGGCVFKITYAPWEMDKQYPILLEKIMPKTFICRPNYSDYWKLKEAWIIEDIGSADAALYGVSLGEDEIGTKIEYWSLTKHKITINGQTCTYIDNNGDLFYFDEKNIFNDVPIVYIPHIRTNTFYGENVIEPIIGLVEEQNLRMADYGDAISDDSHKYIAMRNVNGSPTIKKLANGLNVIDLGSTQTGMTSSEGQPDILEVNKTSASAPMADINQKLLAQIRRDSFVPAIADGEDEGSQRSALTLAMRMWPLTSHIRHERIHWSTGLTRIHQLIMKILFIKDENKEFGIKEEHLKVKFRYTWAPSLPKDRDSIVTEVATLSGSEIQSPENAIEKLGNVDDVEEEMERILDWIKQKAEIQAKANPNPAFGGNGGSNVGGNNPNVKKPPNTKIDGGKK